MWTAKWILDSYEKGDESVRWDLYMAYPDLRCYFDELDVLPAVSGEQKDVSDTGKSDETWWSHCCRPVRG